MSLSHSMSDAPKSDKLIPFPDCDKKFSRLAKACPHCGRPNEAVIKAEKRNLRGNTQGAGCLLKLVAAGLMLVSPALGGIAFVFGFILLLWGLVR